jgi:threonine synthase
LRDLDHIVTLGEGDAPLLVASRLGQKYGLNHLYIKDESGQPTGSFKARGLAMAVSRAIELGVEEFVIPTAGNAGGALSAYAARAGKRAHVYMPQDAPAVNVAEIRATGADLVLVDGLISDAGKLAASAARERGWFDVSTMKEPYRLEGKKTMGLELAEAFGWQLPDVIVYPAGGGTGLVGMWKAFQELDELGWLANGRPKMVAVQAAGCAPVVRAFNAGARECQFWPNARTIAAGLRVPHAFGHKLILKALYESNGRAVAVTDDEIRHAQEQIARLEGIFAAPEGAATLAGAIRLLDDGWLDPDTRIVLYNTGTGLKYVS